MNKQQLASKIWESANKMRSKIEANEYKDFIFGFIFYKFLSEKEEQYLLAQGMTAADMEAVDESDVDTVRFMQDNLGYFIAYEDLFSTWIAKGSDFEIADVRDALSAFNRHINPRFKNVYGGIFDTLQTGLSKLGESAAAQTKATRNLLHLIKDIPMDSKQDYDVLGFIYEYLIGMFAANAGKKAGEFYTPHEVSLLMSEIVADHLQNRSEIRIYDPASGSGSLLINIGAAVTKHLGADDTIKYYAQELKKSTYDLTRMNLVMRGINPSNIIVRNGDTLEDDWPYFEENDPNGTYEPLFVDAVVANPPYSQHWEPDGKENDPRFSRFGVAPQSKADYAFLLHGLFHLQQHGIMTIVLPHGVLFRGGEEEKIRQNLIEHDKIAAIIGLPANIFFGTGIPTIIMVLRQKRVENDVLIVDASKGFEKKGKSNVLRASDIKRIVDTVNKRQTIEGYSRLVGKDEIRSNGYNLNIPRYVDSSETAETYDLYASMYGGIPLSEVDALDAYWREFPGLREALFSPMNPHCASLNTEDIQSTIEDSNAVCDFVSRFREEFKGLRNEMVSALIGGWETVDIQKEEGVLASSIFERIAPFKLLDKYKAYQVLDDAWNGISADLEMMQTEGFDATRKVDARMVLKKKGGKEIEVQDGWVGHIMPFSLVQDTLLADDSAAVYELRASYDRVSSAASELSEELEDDAADMTEEGAESKQKELDGLKKQEKSLKKSLKTQEADLEEKTRMAIEGLTDERVYELLEKKWAESLLDQLNMLPQKAIDGLVKKVKDLNEKYSQTFASISAEIESAEKELSAMIDDLVGNEFDMAGLKEFQRLLVM